jgi:hypothetical protein
MSKKYNKTDKIGYNVDSSPITKAVLIKRVKEASLRVKSGEFITQEYIEKEIENW